MSENDYIAEYIKERYPKLLGFEYTMWKISRKCVEIVADFIEALRSVDTDVLKAFVGEKEEVDESQDTSDH